MLRTYRRRDVGPDVLAGLVICLVLIPSTLAYAELAGSTPVAGIYAALAGTLAYFLFTSSRHVNVGPDGAVALLVGSVVIPLAAGDPDQGLVIASWLAVFTGLVLLVAAALRLGVVANFLSAPVLLGYLNGAALVIVISQWDKLFGLKLENDRFFLRLAEWIEKLGDTHVETLAVGVSVIVLLILFKRLIRKLPPIVPVFFIALGAGLLVDFEALGIPVLGAIEDRAPQTVSFTMSLDRIAAVATGAIGLAMLIFPEGVLLGRAMAEKHGYEVDGDRELLAFGASNIASGAVLGFSVGSSQTRTLVGSASGGRTQVSNLVSAALLVAFLAFAMQWIASLPKVAIAAMLVYTGFGLIDIKSMRRVWSVHRPAGWIALVTAVCVVVVGVLPGILLGTFLSIAILLAQLARPHDALLGRLPGSSGLHDVGIDAQADTIPGLVAYRFYGPLMFANVGHFMQRIQKFIDAEETPVREVLIDASAMPTVDFTALEKLGPFFERLRAREIRIVLAEARHPLGDSTLAARYESLIPDRDLYESVEEARAYFEGAAG